MEDGTGVDKKVINVLGPLYSMYKEKVEEFDQLRKVYTDDNKIYVTVSSMNETQTLMNLEPIGVRYLPGYQADKRTTSF